MNYYSQGDDSASGGTLGGTTSRPGFVREIRKNGLASKIIREAQKVHIDVSGWRMRIPDLLSLMDAILSFRYLTQKPQAECEPEEVGVATGGAPTASQTSDIQQSCCPKTIDFGSG
jgi:hypothetical protein